MSLEAFREKFSLEAWFRGWSKTLAATPAAADSDAPASLRRMVVEALSDAGAEQFLNPLVAQHLRRYGNSIARELASDRQFWVRSEWEKVDLSYGFALPFEPGPGAWNRAWIEAKTGDLGQCEVKAIYAHRDTGAMKTLAGQLEARRAKDEARKAPGFALLRYHAIVWLFAHEHGDAIDRLSERVHNEARTLGLQEIAPSAVMRDDLGMLWPSTNGATYRCSVAVALFELQR